MGELPLPAVISWLVHERFGGYDALTKLAGAMDRLPPESAADAAAFRELLQTFSEERLRRLFGERVQDLIPQANAVILDRESLLFFNRPIAQADYAYWVRMPIWTVEDAAALSLGRDPRVVNWAAFEAEKLSATPFASQYLSIADLIQRSVDAGNLDYPLEPPLYRDWCRKIQLGVPDELSAELKKVAGAEVDWRAAYLRLLEMHGDLQNTHLELERTHEGELETHAECRAKLQRMEAFAARTEEELHAERAERVADINALRGELAELQAADFDPREKESAVKLIIGIVRRRYGFDPAAKKSDVVRRIMHDLDLEGVGLSDETIRKFLRLGAAYLTGEAKEDVA